MPLAIIETPQLVDRCSLNQEWEGLTPGKRITPLSEKPAPGSSWLLETMCKEQS